MRTPNIAMFLVILATSLGYAAWGGTISGTVKDPDGAPFKGAFVRARNENKTKITVSVLSDKQGHYRIENLSPGGYQVQVTAVGYKSAPRTGVNVAAGEAAPLDFALQMGMVRWSDVSIYQGRILLPEGKGKALLFERCLTCHGFQSRMAATRRDEAGWARAVNFMRDILHYALADTVDDQGAADVISYLNTVFGIDSELPRSPADLPEYKKTVRSFSDEAMKIVYVDYDLPAPNRFPWSANPDKDGKLWMPYYGRANRIGRLDPNTGEVQEFLVPNQGTAGIHSVMPTSGGPVWFSEQGSNKLGRWDPGTQQIIEYQDTYKPGMEGRRWGGSRHTVRVDQKGNVWATGYPLTRFDPKTGKFNDFPEVPNSYGIAFDREDNPWFAEWMKDGKIGKVDAKTGKVTKWAPPTTDGRPRRIQIDSDGIVWFAEYNGGKIGRFDPKTETFKEYQVPGPDPTPYALGIDKNNRIWYSSDNMDVLGCLDPKTGQIIEYPTPYPENGMREFFFDPQGRAWFATGPNNKVGYFILSTGS